MTKYLDEHDSKATRGAATIQTDDHKLKFNNIQSCIAVFLVPAGGRTMTGVHLTFYHTQNKAELRTVLQNLQRAVGPGPCDGYLVSTWANHKKTDLAKELKKFVGALYSYDVPPRPGTNDAADIDLKVELAGGGMQAFIRLHAVNKKDEKGAAIVKPNYDRDKARAHPGKPMYVTDRDSKPWVPIPFLLLR